MFKIEEIDLVSYRKQTRKSMMIMIGIFIVIGFMTARLTVIYFGDYSNNHLVLNFMGAFAGLLLTFWMVKKFFKEAAWMKETIYTWELKRHLMAIYNVLTRLEEAVKQKDREAIKILRFYHLGTEQMYRFDGNSHELIELQVKMKELESKMTERGLELNQIEFDMESLESYRN